MSGEDDDWFADDGSTDEDPDPDLEKVFADTSDDVAPVLSEEEMGDDEAMERRLAMEEVSAAGVKNWEGDVPYPLPSQAMRVVHGVLHAGRIDPNAVGCFLVEESGKRTPLAASGTGYCPTCTQAITSAVLNS